MATFNWGIVVLFYLFSNHDFGLILSPFGVRALYGTNGNLWYEDTPCQYQE